MAPSQKCLKIPENILRIIFVEFTWRYLSNRNQTEGTMKVYGLPSGLEHRTDVLWATGEGHIIPEVHWQSLGLYAFSALNSCSAIMWWTSNFEWQLAALTCTWQLMRHIFCWLTIQNSVLSGTMWYGRGPYQMIAPTSTEEQWPACDVFLTNEKTCYICDTHYKLI